ncbi:hypothetical protein CN918_27595 [Priestia megaterium]|nr:hypothetical protein CN918_27595 [Priestia megaterium]
MKNKLGLSQIIMLSKNGVNAPLLTYFDFDGLIDSFFTHLSDFFLSSNMEFKVLEPFLSHDFQEKQQSTSISLSGTKLGELCLSHNSIYDFSSLVYYSSTGLLETFVLNESLYTTYTINDYLAILHEFSSMLLGEKAFYDHLNLPKK